jgi:hypothetical protein
VWRPCVTVVALAGCNQILGLEPTRPSDAAPATVSFVQANANEVVGDSKLSVAFQNKLARDSAVVVAVYVEATQVASVVDSLATPYSRVVGPIADPSPPPASLYIYAALGSPGGANTVTVTVDQATTDLQVYVHEFANVGSTDGGTGMSGTGGSVDGMTSGTFHTHSANELIFGFGFAEAVDVGTGFAAYSAFNANITEGRTVSDAGLEQAAATASLGGAWTMLAAGLVAR